VIGFDEAVGLVARVARPLGNEPVPLEFAQGRVLSAPVAARVSAPPTDVSAMDGYAVRDGDVGTLPARLTIVGESFPSRGYEKPLGEAECVRIFTGAPVPDGADRIVIQENVRREGDVATIDEPAGGVRHIRKRGSDFEAGDLLLEPGRAMDARALVSAAGADLAELDVWRKPRVFILGTGDELADPGRAGAVPGAIPESISLGVAALAGDWGAEIVGRRCLRDELAPMAKAAGEALDIVDLVVVTGGASVGERDFAKAMFEPAGLELIFSKVSIKPGKPVWLGRARGRLVMGLPGNPTSALVTARLLLAPLLAGLTGRDPAEALRWRNAPLARGLEACGARETFVRARRMDEMASPLSNQDSSAQRTLAAADLLIRRRPGAPAALDGERVEVLDF
jgi:molybdopterin molybdotransferase